MIYILCFLVSIFFIFRAEVCINNNRPYYNCIFGALIFPILLAGFRDVNIGTDVNVYVKPSFDIAMKSLNIKYYINYLMEDDVGFFTYVFYITKLFENFTTLMLLNHILIILPIVYILIKFKKKYKTSIFVGYSIWMFYAYNMSLCVIRQSIAISFALLTILMYIERKYIYSLLFAFIAILFHKTLAFFFLISLGLSFICKKISNKKEAVIFSFILLLSFFLTNYILVYLLQYFDIKYAERLILSDSNEGGLITLMFYLVLSVLPFIIRDNKRHIDYSNFLIYLPIIGVVLLAVSRQFIYLSRMAYPFMVMLFFSIPYTIKNRLITNIILIMFFILWFISIYMRNDWETMPYAIRLSL